MAVDIAGVDINGQKRQLLLATTGGLIVSAGVDSTGAYHPLLTDTSGRIILGAPNANLPITGTVSANTSVADPATATAATIAAFVTNATTATVFGITSGTAATVYVSTITINLTIGTATTASSSLELTTTSGGIVLWAAQTPIPAGFYSMTLTYPRTLTVATASTGTFSFAPSVDLAAISGVFTITAAYSTTE